LKAGPLWTSMETLPFRTSSRRNGGKLTRRKTSGTKNDNESSAARSSAGTNVGDGE